jgi:2-polyprenyl-6-methoxyphenol hydroxylase-like FAD-dependent oxidoreductase
MAPLNVIICGGGCGGPALAYWLARSGHRVTVVERFSTLRASGAQVDLRDPGIEVIKRMGLLDAIRTKRVDEVGTSFVDAQDKTKATIMANKSGKGAQTLTSEYEIMRGDLVRILYDATKSNVEYIFGVSVQHFEQHEDRVEVIFSDGRTDTFDLLVGADGQGSRIRKAILPPDSPEPYNRLGLHSAYWFVPRSETDSNMCKVYHSPGSRAIMCRSHNATETQVYFAIKDDSEELRSLPRASVEQQKAFWTERFSGAGWQTDRFIESMKNADYFYCQEIVQVRTDTWYKNRVVLLGDAGYCPSPVTGMGTTASFVGAYVLAGEINRNANNLPEALKNYEKTLRPFINEIQVINRPMIRSLFPQTQLGISILHFISGIICYCRIPEFLAKFSNKEGSGWNLPDYPEFK